jgi:hypothetical protein
MQAHIIENGVVINTIVVDSLDFMAGLIEAPEGTGIGWSYVNGQFVDNRPKPEVVAPPAPTKEQLLAQLNAIAAQIQALE